MHDVGGVDIGREVLSSGKVLESVDGGRNTCELGEFAVPANSSRRWRSTREPR